MSAAEHADFEALSAYVDGEAPEWADHVEACPRCRSTAAELRALSVTVAAPVEPPPSEQRESAITAALGVAPLGAGAGAGERDAAPVAARHEVERDRFFRRRRPPASWAMPAVAAVVVALLGLSGVILSANRSTDEDATTLAGPALDSSKAESAVPGAPEAPVGDLGDVPDAATLRARALGPPPAASSGRSTASANGGASSDATASGDPGATVPAPNPTSAQVGSTNSGNTGASLSGAPSAASGASGLSPSGGAGGAGGAAAIAPNAVGTRPCEERARTREPALGPVTYFATARRGAVPAYVLGFASGPNVTLLMLAQDGCGELLRSAGP